MNGPCWRCGLVFRTLTSAEQSRSVKAHTGIGRAVISLDVGNAHRGVPRFGHVGELCKPHGPSGMARRPCPTSDEWCRVRTRLGESHRIVARRGDSCGLDQHTRPGQSEQRGPIQTTCLAITTRRPVIHPDCPNQSMSVYRWVRKPGRGGPAARSAQKVARRAQPIAKKCAKTCAQRATKPPENRFQTDLWVSRANWSMNTVFAREGRKHAVAQRRTLGQRVD